MRQKPTVLMILDGYGLNEKKDGNAVAMAKTPVVDKLMKEYPCVKGLASGMAVGLPDGQMGNSEVGHLNMGAGRIVYQELTRISKEIKEQISPKESVCPDCEGHGFICPGDPRADDPEGCHGNEYVTCKACNSTGYQDGELCSWCKGTLTHLCPSFESHYTCPTCNGSGYIH